MEEVYVNREDLENWSIGALKNLRREVKWALETKEKKDKVVIWKVVEYTGTYGFFIDFNNALKYVMENTEKAYVEAKDRYFNEGMISPYESLYTSVPRIEPVLILPDQITGDPYYVDRIVDSQKEKKR